jgi:hypothetical protein
LLLQLADGCWGYAYCCCRCGCCCRGIESCGILAGRLSASDSRFTITTLIVPKQTGTSDTVEMLGEEEVWEAEVSWVAIGDCSSLPGRVLAG